MKTFNKILIVGAGEAGIALFKELKQRGFDQRIVGFVDDDKDKIGSFLNGALVLGPVSEISNFCHDYRITDVIVAVPSASPAFITDIISSVMSCSLSINLYIVPVAEKFFDSVPIFPSLKQFDYSDILERDQFTIDMNLMENFFRGKKVLITGAGGSIGSEICRQLLKFRVNKIIALGRGENSIYNLSRSMDGYSKTMGDNFPELAYRIADVKDFRLLSQIFKREKPDIVFHAAAHKHVPLMEFNEAEALQNNVLGCNNVLKASLEHDVEKFVFISTDKAVKPSSIMGATKRMGELITGYFRHNLGLNTAVVRFGNVLGSRGSVIPLFNEQIDHGGPVTVTHPDVKRYFMSISEASLLVLNSGALSDEGEIFVLNMGEQFRISDIAEKMILLRGLTPGEEIEIEYTGLRPGEKLFEELFYKDADILETGNRSIFLVKKDSTDISEVRYRELISAINDAIWEMNSLEIRDFIKEFLPEYNP
ncbi:MAG: nucleoside-diphosphate sugar epimerase/dehydratase [Spirochaetota bacterium]